MAHKPAVHNPFPQLSRVAVAPFFNLSDEPTVDGRRFALAYFAELQAVPGFEVVPVSVVETVMRGQGIELNDGREARRLAQLLGVDAVVVGAVTDYSPYYPPRCGLQVQWWAASPCFHPIPPGYGLPWCTPEEEYIPAPVVFDAEMALARAQLKTQTPDYEPIETLPAPASDRRPQPVAPLPLRTPPDAQQGPSFDNAPTAHQGVADPSGKAGLPAAAGSIDADPLPLPPDWPDARALIPACPAPARPNCEPSDEPVLIHTRIYHGLAPDVTEALATHYHFRDDERFGGWQSYLQRSEDFIRFCCHMHIAEMLTARGGAGQTQVVWEHTHCR
ncbi:MAG: hypothetical protein A2W31_04165 [Planctomycetes bacterium RBG_16_64_10]|nr:MAG: hypothetical protein A2W31_04165 [Planctomycetes bacterium RBG_16_64_10]